MLTRRCLSFWLERPRNASSPDPLTWFYYGAIPIRLTELVDALRELGVIALSNRSGAVNRLTLWRYSWHRIRQNWHNQYLPWKMAWLISGQNSFTMLKTSSNAIWVTHFWPVFVQVRSLDG
jgi:hypothetical protein